MHKQDLMHLQGQTQSDLFPDCIEPRLSLIARDGIAPHIHASGSEWGKDADFSPFEAEGIIAIDACAASSGRVNCIVIED